MKISNIKRNIGKVVEVTWLDASFRNGEDLDKLEESTPKNHLVEATTFGKLMYVDDKAIIVNSHISENNRDVYTIPHGMITEIKIYKTK